MNWIKKVLHIGEKIKRVLKKRPTRDEIKNSHLLYISSPKNGWLDAIKDYIEVSSYLSKNS